MTSAWRWFFRQNLAVQILEGLLLGVVAGLLLPDSISGLLGPVGDGFLRLFQMPVLPFLSLSLIAGVGRLELSQAGRLLGRAALVLLGFWLIVLLALLLIPLGFPNWEEASFFRPSLLQATKPLDLLQLFIPVNPFAAYAETQIPAVVLFSLALGIALILIPRRQNLIDVLDRLSEGLLQISAFVSRFTPLGVFAILASTTAQLSSSEIPRLVIYVVLMGGIALVLSFVVLPLLVQGLTPLKATTVLQRFRTPLTIAFATANLLVVLPLLVDRSKELLLEARSRELQLDAGDRDGTARVLKDIELPIEVLTPLALVFPDMGRVLSLAFVPFAGWMSGAPIGLTEYPGFLLTGFASAFLEGVLAMTFLLNRLGLPTDLVQIYIALDQLAVARLGTLLACMSVLSLVMISTWLSLDHQRKVRRLPWAGLISLILLPLYVGLSRIGFSRMPTPVNSQKQQLLHQGFALAKGPAELVDSVGPVPGAGQWASIRQRGWIRYCVRNTDYPFAYRNALDQLVGVDVEMGLLFAEQMGLKAEFLEVNRLPSSGQTAAGTTALLDGLCDLRLSMVIVDPTTTDRILSTRAEEPITLSVLLVEQRFTGLRSWSDLQQIKGVRVGVVGTSAFQLRHFEKLLPDALFLRGDHHPELVNELLERRIDLLLMPAQMASSWTVLHPEMRMIVPQPDQRLPVTREVAADALELRRVWDVWLEFQITDGSRNEVFDHWVEGISSPGEKS